MPLARRFGYQRPQLLLASCIENHDGRSLARNRILRAAAVEVGDFDRQRIQQALKNAAQNPQRIAASLMNVDPGVAALQARTLMRHAVSPFAG